MNQNLNHYKVFYTVAKYKNISKAADALFISQPAISKTLSKLEENLGCSLFHRTSRGVTLTTEGQILYERIREAFQVIDSGEEEIRHINELGIGQIRIGVSTTLCKYILLPYLQDFIKEHPHIKITIECQSTLHTIEMLENGSIDIGLIGVPKKSKIPLLPHKPIWTICLFGNRISRIYFHLRTLCCWMKKTLPDNILMIIFTGIRSKLIKS